MKTMLRMVLAACVAAPAVAQLSVPANTAEHLRDTSALKPPVGAKVAIVEFEDLECPFCAHVAPIVRGASVRYKIPVVRYDYPLYEIHSWSMYAATTARYLEDKASPRVAEQFRMDVFAHQNLISSRDDLAVYSQHWFTQHGQTFSFLTDGDPKCRQEVMADRAVAEKMHLMHTPCVFVVTAKEWIEVNDPGRLDEAIRMAMADEAPVLGRKK